MSYTFKNKNTGKEFAKGDEEEKKGNFKKAIKYYENAIKIEPECFPAWHFAGQCHGTLRNFKKAIECYEKAVEIEPNFALSWFNMGIIYGHMDEHEKAVYSHQKVLTLNPGGAQGWLMVATVLLYRTDEIKMAYKLLLKSKDADPTDPRLPNLISLAKQKLGIS